MLQTIFNADILESAFFAFWLSCRTHVSSVQDKPMVRLCSEIFRYIFFKFFFNSSYSFAGRKPYAMGYPENVCIDSNYRFVVNY